MLTCVQQDLLRFSLIRSRISCFMSPCSPWGGFLHHQKSTHLKTGCFFGQVKLIELVAVKVIVIVIVLVMAIAIAIAIVIVIVIVLGSTSNSNSTPRNLT